MTYQPTPVDTSQIDLSDDIEQLTEEMARHAHDVWARQRIQDGWRLGKSRDDEKKEHPCLVPYEELSEQEKQYDRNAATETLKVILAKGYRIVPPTDGSIARSQSELGALPAANALVKRLRSAQQQAAQSPDRAKLELAELLEVWNSRREDDRVWRCEPELYRHLAQRFLKLGEAPLAREVAQTALELSEQDGSQKNDRLWNHDVKLRQLFGLALARSGNTDDSQKVLLELLQQGNVDTETLGLLGRTYKDQAHAPGVSDEHRSRCLKNSLKHYRHAYQLSDGFWTGINVATIERLMDNGTESQRVAQAVGDQCLTDLKEQQAAGATPQQTYWHLATLGEVALNLGDFDEAGKRYHQAYLAAPKNFGDLDTTRRHARWLLDHWIEKGQLDADDSKLLDQWMPIPKVVVFSGHMIDGKDRDAPRFPDDLAAVVGTTIKNWLQDNHALIGYSSAACGSDLLFQQAIQQLGGESRLVLPYDTKQFKADSVSFAGEKWSNLFDEVLSNATQLVVASPKRAQGDGISYDYANLVLHGLATVRATELKSNGGEPVGLVVWNGLPGDGMGGTASVVKRWRGLDMDLDQIDLSPNSISSSSPIAIIKNPTPPEIVCEGPQCEVTDTRIMAMLFGDAVNFSSLDEQQVGRFIQHFMSPIAKIVRGYGEANVIKNTWGDALYLVFDHVRQAGLCALDICDFTREQIETRQWQKNRLPENLNVRIALHAGPVFGCIDPVTGLKNYTGTHVSRAARLEPKTPPGEVYASEAFAALCAEYKVGEFFCDYVKQLAWAKHYGSFPTFVLRRR